MRRRFGYRCIGAMLERKGLVMNEKSSTTSNGKRMCRSVVGTGRIRALGSHTQMPVPLEANQRWSLGFASEHRLPEGRNQLFQTLVTSLDSDRNSLQRSNSIRKICHVHLNQRIANLRGIFKCNQRDNSSLCSHPIDKGASAPTARTRRQSSPANNASNWGRPRFITPSLIAGQVNVCSSSRM